MLRTESKKPYWSALRMVASGYFLPRALRPALSNTFVECMTSFKVARHPRLSKVDRLRDPREARNAG